MVLDAFEQRRAVVLAGLQAECGDKSRKGSVDAPIASLVARINAHPGVYTTSSCSGRISVFGEPTPESRAGGKKGGEWAYASHEPADKQEVIASVHRSSAGGARLVLRFEPFVLHLEARTPEMGQRVLAAARAAGFRESGLTLGSGGRRVMVGVRCSLRLEAPVADAGRVLVPDDYLSYLVDLANDKFQQNLDRIAKFEAELLAVLDAPAPSGFQLSQPPAPPPRQNASAVRHTPAAAAADGAGAGPSGRPAAAAAAGGLAAAPVRRRGAGGGSGLAMAPTAAVEALRKRQARVLGRLTALEQKLGGSKAGPSRAAGGGGGSGGSRTGGAAAKGAAAAAAEAAGAKRDKGVAAAADEGAGGLRWLPVPLSPELQGSVDETVPRWGHASVSRGSTVYLLGGYGGGGAHARRDDVIMYDTVRQAWTAQPPPAPGAPPPPSPRMGGAAVCAGSGGRFAVLVGGRTSPMDALSDVWILDLDLGTWVRARPEVDPMTTAGAPLPVAVAAAGFLGRYRHSVVAVPPPPPAGSSTASTAGTERIPPGAALAGWRVVVFGGRNADVVLGDTWVLSRVGAAAGSDDLAAGWRWQLVAAAGAAPGPRKSHAACFVPGSQTGAAAAASHGSMYVHGGTCGYGMHVSEMYCLDLGSYVWHRVDGAGAGGGGGSGGGSPACFSHTLNRWGPYLLLVGGYPTDHHRQLWVFDTRTHVWTALDAKEAAPPTAAAAIAGAVEGSGAAVGGGAPSLDFLPVRHCAEVVSSDGTDGLYVMGGGAFCFSFGTVFGGCFRLPLAGVEQALAAAAATPLQRRPVQKAVAPKAPASTGTAAAAAAAAGAAPTGLSPASSPAPSAKADTAGVANGNSGAGGAGGSSGGEGWVVCVPAAAAKGVKDALKAAGWLDASRRATVDAAAADADAAAAAAADGPGLSGDAATGPRVALVRLPVTNLAAAALGASADGSGGGGGSAAAEAARRAVAATGGQLERCTLAASSKQPASPGQRLRAAAEALLSAASPPPPPALSARLLASLPTRWERLGDLVLLPAGAFSDPGWAQALGGSTEGAKGEGEEAVLVPLWRAVAAALGAERLARQAPVANTGTRDSRAQLLLGSHGWVAHREGGVTFQLDVTRCMFSSGNVTERTRLGWGRGGHLSGARLAAAAAAAAASRAPGGTLPSAPAAGKAKGKAKADAAGAARGAGVEAGVAKEAAAAGPVEGCGGVAGWAAGETVVDLYTGIGYYTLPLLVVGGVDKVYACEWNPHALEALRRNLAQPGLGDRSGAPVGERCEVREGDCRTTAPQGVADRVLLGLLPSSRGGWEAAVRALKPEGGWLHLHHNVTDREEGAWAQACLGELEELARSAGRDWELRLAHLERVKWYAPHIRHVVLDIECRPRGSLTANRPQPPPTANGQALTAPVKAPPRPAQSQTAAAVGASGTGSAHATAALSPPAWCKQPLEQLQLVRRVRAEEVGDRAAFEASISAARLPVVIEGMDVGPAPGLWTPEHLLSLPDSHRIKVSLHVTRAPGGRLDFVHKNFAFRTMALAEAVGRIARKTPAEVAAAATAAGVDPDPSVAAAAEAGAWPELVPPGQEYGSCAEEALYLRSIGDNPRKEASNLSSAFPCLAPDVTIPLLVPPGAMHSSVLRLSSPGLVLWTHYDVCDNFLIQVTGSKRVLLWPPSAHDPLHVEGSSSPVTDPCNPDLSRHPRFASCPPPLLVDLQPGEVLFLPSLWFHHVTATGGAMSISVNAFFRHLPAECYHRKDLYGNRDLVQAEEADRLGCEAVAALAALPPHYRGFYGARLLGSIQRELGL